MTIKNRSLFYLSLLLMALATAWLTGFILFVTTVHDLAEPPIDGSIKSTEAIVVLTGGRDRLATGIELIKAGKGQKLLISGVYPGVNLDNLLGGQSIDQSLRDCCIILGHSAADTIGNAEETKQWMQAENFHSLRLVTAHYHMPRSLLLFHEVMPDIEIIAHPVAPENVKIDNWWLWPGTISLLATEYNKYLFASMREKIRDMQ